MKLTKVQEQIVRHTWGILRNVDPLLVGDVFYTKLFFENPELRRMFPEEMEGQYQKLVSMLGLIAGRIDALEALSEEITALAKRHEGYGVKPKHYDLVGEALLWTLESALGTDWNNDVKVAWTKCYQVLSEAMIRI